MINNYQTLLQDSFHDLKDDFEELLYLTNYFLSQLNKFSADLRRIEKSIRRETYQMAVKEVKRISKRLEKYKNQITKSCVILVSHAIGGAHPESEWDAGQASMTVLQRTLTKLEEKKKVYFDLIRTQAGIIGPLITSLDWQSPSFLYSQYSQAGKQTGKIKGTMNDYKRDTHLDEEEFEKAYIREYIDAPFKFGLKALMTSSGMSAFTTIFNFLLMEGKLAGKILLGKSSYFQYKQLVISALSTPGESLRATPGVLLRPSIIEVDESNTEGIIQSIKNSQPSAIFLDSLCNAKDIPVPDLPVIINFLVKDYKKDVYLVIDNTGLSITYQPFMLTGSSIANDPRSSIAKLIKKAGKLHLLLFESLMKYVHFGLDRVTGGIIVAKGKDAVKLFEYRKHLGTNIPDDSTYAFPTPNRKMLEKRLKRLGRNASILAASLQEYIDKHPKCSLKKIIYPALISPRGSPFGHPRGGFRGSFFNLAFKKKNVRLYKRFIETAIKEAKRQKVDLIGGTSFGLNTTRIYLTSLWTKYGEPFVRVSVGTENKLQIEALKKVFVGTINKMKYFPLSL